MEQRLHVRLQIHAHHSLSNPIRNSRHPENPYPSRFLRYLHGTNRRRKIRPRRHTIPHFVEIPFQVLLESFDRFAVDTGRTGVSLDFLISVFDNPLGDHKRLLLRLRSAHRLISPHRRLTDRRTRTTRPLRSTRVTRLRRYYGAVRPCIPHRYSAPRGFCHLEFSLSPAGRLFAPRTAGRYRNTSSHVPCQSPNRARATFRPDTAWAVNRLPPDSSRGNDSTPLSMSPLRFRPVIGWFASARLLGSYLTG
jgi:hypothetical protein